MSHRAFLVAAILIFALGITISSAQAETTYIIPDWVKEITGLWVEDKISDNSYLDVITFLIDKKIIIVPLIQELENEVIQLKNENEQLRLELDDSTSQIKAESSALPPTGITAKTDKYSYKKGDIISSTGIVSNRVGDIGVLFSMYNPNENLLAVYQLTPNDRGYFFVDVLTNNPLWDITGPYTAVVSYGPISEKITFYFDAEPSVEILGN